MADEYHKVIEWVQRGFDRDRVYMATHDGLRAKGWNPTSDYLSSLEILNVVDEQGRKFYEAVEGWNAQGNDAWVSKQGYPATTTIQIRAD